jgi:hypothetical protein
VDEDPIGVLAGMVRMLAILLTTFNGLGCIMTCCTRRAFRLSIHSINEIAPSVLGNLDITLRNLACAFLDDVQQYKEVP